MFHGMIIEAEEAVLNPRKHRLKKLIQKRRRKRGKRKAKGLGPAARALLGVPPVPKRRRAKQVRARGKLPPMHSRHRQPPMPPRTRMVRSLPNGLAGYQGVGVDHYGVAVQNACALVNEGSYGGSLTKAQKRAQAARTKWLKKRAKKIKKLREEAQKRQAARKAGRAERREVRREMWRG